MPFLAVLAAATGATAEDGGALAPRRLRCEYLVDPLGIDVVQPRLSWIVVSPERGQRQTAYRVLVASSPEKLAADQGDLWDTGRVESDQTIHVVYQGSPLESQERCYWKVRVWDRQGQPSAWSEPASWSMGLLDPADWRAQWIAADVKPAGSPPRPSHNGFHSEIVATADVTKWVAVDLGKVQQIDAVKLYPAHPYDYADTPGFLFPVRFAIDVASAADFSDAKRVVDRTEADVANPGDKAMLFEFAATPGRYVRVTATRLAQRDPGVFAMALAEMDVLAEGNNVAEGATVTAGDSIEQGGWSRARLVDGQVKGDPGNAQITPQPVTVLRKDFALPGKIKRATAYVTGLGLYELWMNGHRVGDHLLAPEWTLYPKRLQYQTYDVTDLLREGDNAVGAMLAEGWYAGPLAFRTAMSQPVFRLLMRLEVEMADGTRQSIVSDGSWRGTTDGPIRASGIYAGETYDARMEMPGWNEPGFDAKGWKPVRVVPADAGKLVAQPNEPIRVTREIAPMSVSEPKPGVFVYDFGQNMVGWCRIKLAGPAGATVTTRHAEILNKDGTLFTANLGSGAQINRYTFRGDVEEVFEPRFTYHGFRYLEITGPDKAVPIENIVGRVFHSDAPDVGKIEFSEPLLNEIMRLVIWVQRANLESTPTDCPQRGERLGWMGDIQSFAQTAIFNMDMAAFFTKWIPDVRDSQADDGRFADFSPRMVDKGVQFTGVPAWGDAGTIVPWRVYQNYADERMLAQHFDAARRWVDYIHRNNPNLLWQKSRGNDYNDWLNGDTMTVEGYPKKGSAVPNEVFATAFFAHSTEIVAKMARVLGREAEAAEYGKLAKDIKKAFCEAYVAPDGKIHGDTQAGYAVALAFDMVDESMRPALMGHALAAIKRFNDHLSTGIQTTHRMMLELTRNGQHAEAYRLAMLRTVPSWGYMVEMGATTIWERWDGYVEGRGMNASGMNSLNHWALGAVGEWMWRNLAGIHPDETQPGFKHFLVRPLPVGNLKWVKARYDSIRGPIESRWEIADGRITLRVVVPANTMVTVYVPTRDPAKVTEGGQPVDSVAGIRRLDEKPADAAAFEVEPGTYEFVAPW
ncbi:MAG: glycoside hydrolase family 78 protein [Pirellulales bacterium]|nr:glycoside hydrolase family 78 protein [Pirellulales bacterium]